MERDQLAAALEGIGLTVADLADGVADRLAGDQDDPEQLRREIAKAHGIEAHAHRLTGTTRADLEADAKELAGELNAPRQPATPDEWMRRKIASDAPSRVALTPSREHAPPAPAPPATRPQPDLEQTEIRGGPGDGGPLPLGLTVEAGDVKPDMDAWMRSRTDYQ